MVIVNLKGMLMQVRDIPYLWRRDKPDCVSKTAEWHLPLETEWVCSIWHVFFYNNTGGMVGYLHFIYPAGAGSWIGCRSWRGTGQHHPEDSVVSIQQSICIPLIRLTSCHTLDKYRVLPILSQKLWFSWFYTFLFLFLVCTFVLMCFPSWSVINRPITIIITII